MQKAARGAFFTNSFAAVLNGGAIAFDITHHEPVWKPCVLVVCMCIAATVATLQYRRAFGKSITCAVLRKDPDLTEPIIAYRAWDIEGPADAPVLAPITQSKPWAIRKAEAANVDEHGYYGFKDEDALEQVLSWDPNRVLGRVALWGRVKEHHSGYRAEYAYPQVLYTHPLLDEKRVKATADRYGIETCPMPQALSARLDPILEAMQEQQRERAWEALYESERFSSALQDVQKYAEYMTKQRQRRVGAAHDAIRRMWR